MSVLGRELEKKAEKMKGLLFFCVEDWCLQLIEIKLIKNSQLREVKLIKTQFRVPTILGGPRQPPRLPTGRAGPDDLKLSVVCI